MGQSHSRLSDDQLKEYQELTFFNKSDIVELYKKWCKLAGQVIAVDSPLPINMVQEIPELAVNPFRDRICKVFSFQPDEMTFEDYLDMMSIFSENAPVNVKAEYAFRIYDFDQDDMLSRSDLRAVVSRLTRGLGTLESNFDLSDDELQQLINKVFEEADLDNDDHLSYSEFEHVVAKAPDFANAFRIRI